MGSSDTIPSDWNERSMSEIASVRFSGVDKKSLEDETPVRLCNYMEVWKNPYIHDDMPFMEATATDREIDQFSLKINDVLLTKDSETKNEIAQPSVVQEELNGVVLGYHLALLRPNPKKAHGPFLAAQLAVPRFRRHFVRVAGGATRYGIGIEEVRKAVLWLPSIAEQKAISGILRCVDTAIERTRAVIEQVRVVKQALLADLMTNGLPGRHKKFKTVKGLGRIPADWKVVRLDKIAQVDRGKFTHRPRNEPRFYGGVYPFVQTGDVREAMGWLRTYSQTLNDDGLAISRLFPRGTIIITIAANIGETAIAALDVAFPDSLIGVVPEPDVHTEYLEMYLRTRQPMLRKMATESAQANITLVDVRRIAVCLPSDDEQIQIAGMLTTLEQRELVEVEGLDQMVVLKAALSDALLTGRVRVPHAEGVAAR